MTRPLAWLPLVALLAPPLAHAGARIDVAEDTWLGVGLLVQPQLLASVDDAGSAQFDARVRRTRPMVYGQLGPHVNFFVESDSPNLGSEGNFTPGFFVQDAYVELVAGPALQVDVGLLLLPTSRHGIQSATSLLGVDYRAGPVKHPPGATLVWRDVGAMARGMLFDDQLEYRFAVTNGVQRQAVFAPPEASPLDGDLPRFTARLTANAFEAEGGAGVGGMFADGSYLKRDGDRLISPRRVLAFGLSGSWQPDTHYDAGEPHDFLSAAADVFVDLPLGDGTRALNAQVGWLGTDLGPEQELSGHGLLAELGFRVGELQPLVALEAFGTPAPSGVGDLVDVTGGLNWWIRGHSASVKAQIGARRAQTVANQPGTFSPGAVVQTQVAF